MRPASLSKTRGPAYASTGLGLAGSLLIALAGPRLTIGARWWFDLRIPAALGGNGPAFYAGMVMMVVAWLGLGRYASMRVLTPRHLWIIGGLWCLPLVAGPALFSRDVYSYLAQGTLVHLGVSPYHYAPVVLRHLGHQHVLNAVAPFWRKTTAPYGPLFLAVVSLIVGISGSHLVLGVLLIRLVELSGIVLVAMFVPRLARTLGADPSRATWLALLSPIVMLELVAAAHNDVLMMGLLVAGLALAVDRRPLLGIGLCALAATIKVPAAAAIVFIAVAWTRDLPTPTERLRFLAAAGAVTIGVVAAVSLVTGLGVGWVSGSVFSTPGRVQLAITPATAVGWTTAHFLHGAGVRVHARSLEYTLTKFTFALSALLGFVLLWRTRRENVVRYLGIVLVVSAICGPAAWPWYLTWGLALLATCPDIQRSRLIPVVVAISVFAVKADGLLAASLRTAPWFAGVYVAIALGAWLVYRRRQSGGSRGVAAGGMRRAPSAFAES
jgi:alpha-1,6-mannosyltransferase